MFAFLLVVSRGCTEFCIPESAFGSRDFGLLGTEMSLLSSMFLVLGSIVHFISTIPFVVPCADCHFTGFVLSHLRFMSSMSLMLYWNDNVWPSR